MSKLFLNTVLMLCRSDSDESKDTSSYLPNDKTPETIFSQSWTTCQTTSTEVDFRRDLAALDADIARLQIQFNVAHQ